MFSYAKIRKMVFVRVNRNSRDANEKAAMNFYKKKKKKKKTTTIIVNLN